VAFGISGFGAERTAASPQVFQALSLAGQVPQPPAPPYGTPNQNLVPVTQPGSPAVPANLTLAANSTFTALLRITSQTALSVIHPPVSGGPNTTTGVEATNPAQTFQLQGPAPSGVPGEANLPQGPVSFIVTASSDALTSGAAALTRTVEGLQSAAQQVEHAVATRSTTSSSLLPVAAPHAVAKIISTIKSLAVGAVYPSPVFAFHA